MNTNIHAIILAGGSGSRVKGATLPKQFIKIGTKPLLTSTVEKFVFHPEIQSVCIVAPKAWLSHTRDLFHACSYAQKLIFCEGGRSRQESLYLGTQKIQELYGPGSIILSHDAARPFVSLRVINDNINALLEGASACDTVIPATDTIVCSQNNQTITSIPDRRFLYQGQTPQSFFAKDYLRAYETIGECEEITDAAKLLLKVGVEVKLVEGDPFNIKITNDHDVAIADFLLSKDKE